MQRYPHHGFSQGQQGYCDSCWRTYQVTSIYTLLHTLTYYWMCRTECLQHLFCHSKPQFKLFLHLVFTVTKQNKDLLPLPPHKTKQRSSSSSTKPHWFLLEARQSELRANSALCHALMQFSSPQNKEID